ncbi:hypothetical protein CBR_g46330 [Chara braunii]|uniref:Uncharacterized protein n=1 Tax=Chara braunii TaxID=69332 RepID=A0A388M0F4_CHABU|nr:hypothetical protein CBR_g46330 [Chara braunii]|eukprot:GBG87963.1 hypothetical protein CBR_g46330 [Chara braunii]
MVDVLRSHLGVQFVADGGAASSNPPFQGGMTNMLQVIWELEEGSALEWGGLMDDQQEETLMRRCYDIFEKGQDVFAALEEEWYLHLETGDEDNIDACIISTDELEGGQARVDDALTADKHINNNNNLVPVCGSNMEFASSGACDNNNIDDKNDSNNTIGNYEVGSVGTSNTTIVDYSAGACVQSASSCVLDYNNNNNNNGNNTNNNNNISAVGLVSVVGVSVFSPPPFSPPRSFLLCDRADDSGGWREDGCGRQAWVGWVREGVG